jgi:hypothetical protein
MKKFLSILTTTTFLMLSTTTWAKEAPTPEQMQEMGKIMGQLQEKLKTNPNMSEEEQEALMMQMMNQSKMGNDVLQKQKEQLPKILKISKSNRVCLGKADTKAETKECEKKSKILAKKIGLKDSFNYEDEEDFVWNKEEKTKILADMDKWIKEMERSLPCVQKANNMSEMMQCTK